MEKLDQILRRFDHRELPEIQWLDNLSLRRIEKLQVKAAEVRPRVLYGACSCVRLGHLTDGCLFRARTSKPQTVFWVPPSEPLLPLRPTAPPKLVPPRLQAVQAPLAARL